jgi:hypothetical protein
MLSEKVVVMGQTAKPVLPGNEGGAANPWPEPGAPVRGDVP